MENTAKILILAFILSVWPVAPASAQPTYRFPQAGTSGYQPGVYPPQGSGVPPSTLGAPAFDPYSANPGAASLPPTLDATSAPYGTTLPPGAAPPPGTVPPYPGTTGNALGGSGTMAPYAQPYGTYPPGAVPGTTPPSLYPNGLNTNGLNAAGWGLPAATRFLTPRFRYTYVDGGNATNDLGINDFDVSVVAAFPNFLLSTQPLYVAPSFSLHLWSGPAPPDGDLPPNAYSAFLDFGWSTDPTQPVGGEIGLRPGVFTDFNTFNTNSFRFMGQGLFRIQTTPTTTLRGGVIYLDRNKLKLLPAFGILWTPNAQTRFDVFFPRPKLAQHLTTTGNQDVWWYLGAEYGDGAWTVQREGGGSDRMDINDIRLIVGIEWGDAAQLQQGRRKGFVEAGWVTDREIIYVATPNESPSLRDSFMLRAGWNY